MTDKFHIELTPNQLFTGAETTCDIQLFEDEDAEWLVFEASTTPDAKLRIRQSEHIKPAEWLTIAGSMKTALEQARDVVGADWNLDIDDDSDFTAYMSVSIKSVVHQKDDGEPEEDEADALRIDYRIERDGVEVQSGMVDWQNGLYLWDAVEAIEFAELPKLAKVIHSICEKSKEMMVSTRCWS